MSKCDFPFFFEKVSVFMMFQKLLTRKEKRRNFWFLDKPDVNKKSLEVLILKNYLKIKGKTVAAQLAQIVPIRN